MTETTTIQPMADQNEVEALREVVKALREENTKLKARSCQQEMLLEELGGLVDRYSSGGYDLNEGHVHDIVKRHRQAARAT